MQGMTKGWQLTFCSRLLSPLFAAISGFSIALYESNHNKAIGENMAKIMQETTSH
jgi:uncharacterized membrane protein